MYRSLSRFLIALSLTLLVGCGKDEAEPAAGATDTSPTSEEQAATTSTSEPVAAELSLKEKAESGDADACFAFGSEFETAGDTESAFKWFKRAAKSSHPDGTYKVGSYYAKGIACEPDMAKARRCYVIASKADQPDAKQALLALVNANEKNAKRERLLVDEEFEGMPKEKALPLMKEKAMREYAEWQKSDEYAQLIDAEEQRLNEEYGVEKKFVGYPEYQPLSLLKRQVSTALEEADVQTLVAKEFTAERLAEVEKKAAEEIPSFAIGETITVQTRRGEVSGKLQKVSDREMRVASTTILLADVPAAERKKLDPNYVKKSRDLIINREYNVPRSERLEELTADIEDKIMLEAGYLYYNGSWVTTDQLVGRLIKPKQTEYASTLGRKKASEFYRAILERNGFSIMGDRVVTLEEKEQLVQQHTAAITQVQQQIIAGLQNAKSPADFTKGINMANQALSTYYLATNRSSLMQAREALMKGKTKLTGIIEHQQSVSRVNQIKSRAPSTRSSRKTKRPSFAEYTPKTRDRNNDNSRNSKNLNNQKTRFKSNLGFSK